MLAALMKADGKNNRSAFLGFLISAENERRSKRGAGRPKKEEAEATPEPVAKPKRKGFYIARLPNDIFPTRLEIEKMLPYMKEAEPNRPESDWEIIENA